MELKDVVLSVLTDIQNEEERLISVASEEKPREKEEKSAASKPQEKKLPKAEMVVRPVPPAKPKTPRPVKSSEELFLKNMKERILVMFEGFNSPNNQNTEAKVDLTINFLEYLLSVTDERLESINASKK